MVTLPPDPYRETMLCDSNGNQIKMVPNGDGTATLQVAASSPAPAAANILNGFVTATATAGAQTLITVPAGRTWSGSVGVACAVAVAGGTATAGQARGTLATAGTGVTPAAGSVMAAEAKSGANVATGTVGAQGHASMHGPLVVAAPVGNSVTVTVTVAITGTAGVVDAWASGVLL